MYLSETAKYLIRDLRGEISDGIDSHKAAICDAMTIIVLMREMHASEEEKKELMNALNVLANYNDLISELSKEQERSIQS